MDSIELKIAPKDWLYIITIGGLFGFFIAWFFYFLTPSLHNYTTIIFSTQTALFIALFSAFFITISNNLILPNINQKFWYIISFGFSFISGAIGFLSSYLLAFIYNYHLINILYPFRVHITISIGFLTFLIGLILHQFISMKYKHESIKSDMLESKIKALENELNPHFLFNALNSVAELIYTDPKKAELALIELSQFLRNAITKESIISIEEELKMVKTYVNIENIRFQEHIKLHIIQESSEIKIPKFSIQLLVENAIKHGYNGEILNIEITILKSKIIAKNSGKRPKEILFGVGLHNLQKRLQILNVGTLSSKVDEQSVAFIINLKEK